MRPLEARINLARLEANYRHLRDLHGGKALAVVKADAYGHGAKMVAKRLDPVADGFAVAYLDEAVELRDAGIRKPIVILDGVFAQEEYDLALEKDVWPLIHDETTLEWFLARRGSIGRKTTVWLKLDTGMRRAGFSPENFRLAHEKLMASGLVENIVMITHFSCADEPEKDFTQRQLKVFNEATQGLKGERSVANTAGCMFHPAAKMEWGRAGIGLYGYSPDGNPAHADGLLPVMRLVSKVVSTRILAKGESVSYGNRFTADKDMLIGLVPCGYADGYPRRPSVGNPVLVDGKPSRIVGRVCMDLLMVEIPLGPGESPDAGSSWAGCEVELWGDGVSLDEIAQRADTISYEILTHLKRAKRVYID